MEPFKNTVIETKMEDLRAQIKMESPKGREARVMYIREMLKDYQTGPERYPKIERDLKRGIRELQQPVNPKEIEKLEWQLKELTKRL